MTHLLVLQLSDMQFTGHDKTCPVNNVVYMEFIYCNLKIKFIYSTLIFGFGERVKRGGRIEVLGSHSNPQSMHTTLFQLNC